MERTGWSRIVLACALALPPATAAADEPRLARQVQADLGLSVIGVAFEQPVSAHLAVQLEAQVFSTYYAPWFDVGDEVAGFGGQVRPTWFRNRSGRGLYVAPYLRVDRVEGERDNATGTGWGYAAGAFAGWAFALSVLDVRVGAGAQYMHYVVDTAAGEVACTTPFVALDLVVGLRL
jgi:hypothetical protein